MKRLRKLTAVVLLAMVMTMSAGLATAGPAESPGFKAKASVSVSGDMTATGVAESPGIFDTILIMATLIM
jgi:hypothetical protein